MEWSQMRSRCPSAKFVTAAKLPDCRLEFTRKSKERNCGVSDAVFDKSESVWGVVYDLSDMEIGLLDKVEGYHPGRNRSENSYVREERHVFRDGNEKQPLLVSIYLGNPQENPPLPNEAYKELLVKGAMQWNLPPDYIEKLKRVQTAEAS